MIKKTYKSILVYNPLFTSWVKLLKSFQAIRHFPRMNVTFTTVKQQCNLYALDTQSTVLKEGVLSPWAAIKQASREGPLARQKMLQGCPRPREAAGFRSCMHFPAHPSLTHTLEAAAEAKYSVLASPMGDRDWVPGSWLPALAVAGFQGVNQKTEETSLTCLSNKQQQKICCKDPVRKKKDSKIKIKQNSRRVSKCH